MAGTHTDVKPMAPPVVLAAARVVDGTGTLEAVDDQLSRLARQGARVRTLEIDSMLRPWDAPSDPSRESFRSGCAPVMALVRAWELLQGELAEAVLIRGEEALRTGYDRQDRRRRMRIYPGTTLPEAYTRLAHELMGRLGIDRQAFRRLADGLLRNYRATALKRGLDPDVGHGERRCTELFRYEDCANPNVDFAGAVLLASPAVADQLGHPLDRCVRLAGAAVETVVDGPPHVAAIAAYAHLRSAYVQACDQAGVPFAERFLAGRALLEAYTCFPPVPLGFLLASGIATGPEELLPVIEAHPLTVTGGMNLAGAPWNNPALHALIVMHERLARGPEECGLVHGNGGVGGYQGVAILMS